MPTTESPNANPEKSNLTPEQRKTLTEAPDTFAKHKDLLKTLLTEEDYNFIAEKVGNQEPGSTEIEELEVEDTTTKKEEPPVEEIPFESI
ncbi:hypothetical protein HOG17_05150 [Candidatus Peregrinibacteria bacterium]|jgi:hypothetical protein|nr:hypothetical protein [Candidatus Peregrinibacteria bacterium]MBT4147817.1 hypothetical protein [Candidatus Peregrinibacteria bacterium]MBT4366025.1 hypothetical protein [Candidatus Peregrinibacteria bacterium]MBT4455684.1 hypothetical protein [Candidatus Peregrinibacteria bacterium]